MQITDKSELVSKVVSRALNNTPVSEILRVYAESLQLHIDSMSDEDFIDSVGLAGYQDLLEEYVVLDTSMEEDSEAVSEEP